MNLVAPREVVQAEEDLVDDVRDLVLVERLAVLLQLVQDRTAIDELEEAEREGKRERESEGDGRQGWSHKHRREAGIDKRTE